MENQHFGRFVIRPPVRQTVASKQIRKFSERTHRRTQASEGVERRAVGS